MAEVGDVDTILAMIQAEDVDAEIRIHVIVFTLVQKLYIEQVR